MPYPLLPLLRGAGNGGESIAGTATTTAKIDLGETRPSYAINGLHFTMTLLGGYAARYHTYKPG